MYRRTRIEGITNKPAMNTVHEVDIHNQQCPICGVIAGIDGGRCSSCGALCRLVDKGGVNMPVPQKVGTIKSINKDKYLKTAAEVLAGESEDPIQQAAVAAVGDVDPLAGFRDQDGEIQFTDAPQMTPQQYSMLILKQIKETVKQNIPTLSQFFSTITISLEPFNFRVARKAEVIDV